MLRNKERAPGFTLRDETGRERSLEELRGGKLFLLLFSRFRECPTSQRDLLAYANVWDRLKLIGARMAVITADSIENHRALKAQLQLPFPLLTDVGFTVSQRYGVYESDEVEEGPQPHGEPAVFLLDVDGNIAYSQLCSGPKGLANPADLALILLYMAHNGGKYW